MQKKKKKKNIKLNIENELKFRDQGLRAHLACRGGRGGGRNHRLRRSRSEERGGSEAAEREREREWRLGFSEIGAEVSAFISDTIADEINNLLGYSLNILGYSLKFLGYSFFYPQPSDRAHPTVNKIGDLAGTIAEDICRL